MNEDYNVIEALDANSISGLGDYILYGHFRLSSDAQSDIYYNVKGALCDPEASKDIVMAVATKAVELTGGKPATLAVKGYGGAILGAQVAQELGWPLLVVRDRQKAHGLNSSVIMPKQYYNDIVIVDDVSTTGATVVSIEESLRQINSNVNVLGAIVAIDRIL